MTYVLLLRGSCIVFGDLLHVNSIKVRIKDRYRCEEKDFEIRHAKIDDVIELPEELQYIRKEIGA